MIDIDDLIKFCKDRAKVYAALAKECGPNTLGYSDNKYRAKMLRATADRLKLARVSVKG